MPDFDPLNPLMSFLLGYDSDVVRDVLYRTGVPANFELNERERFSYRIRSSAYDQRFRRAYNELDDNQKYRASYIIAERLVAIDVGNQDRLNGSLNNIGCRIEDGKLMAELPEVRELFFPPGSQYDAYSGIKSIIDLAQDSIMVVDNYVDPTLFTMLAMLDKKNVKT